MADPAQCPPLTRASVIAAHEIIRPYIHYTPVLTNKTITEIASTPQSPESLIGTPWEGQKPANPKIRVWFKCENLQKVGAFKARGAFHALLRLEREEGWERKKGVVTHSSGGWYRGSRSLEKVVQHEIKSQIPRLTQLSICV